VARSITLVADTTTRAMTAHHASISRLEGESSEEDYAMSNPGADLSLDCARTITLQLANVNGPRSYSSKEAEHK
jgi:hypothetical protein